MKQAQTKKSEAAAHGSERPTGSSLILTVVFYLKSPYRKNKIKYGS